MHMMDTKIKQVDVLPMVKHYITELRLHKLFDKYIRNDSTTVSFAGAYKYQSPAAIQFNFGYNKDHRPDYKQIVFGLNITEDGHVPSI